MGVLCKCILRNLKEPLLQVFQDLKLRDKWIVKRIADNKAIKEEEVYLLDKLNPVARIE